MIRSVCVFSIPRKPRKPCNSFVRKLHKPANHDSHPVVFIDRDLFHTFWRKAISHGSVEQEVCRDAAESAYGKRKWDLLLLSAHDDTIIHRVVHSLQKRGRVAVPA